MAAKPKPWRRFYLPLAIVTNTKGPIYSQHMDQTQKMIPINPQKLLLGQHALLLVLTVVSFPRGATSTKLQSIFTMHPELQICMCHTYLRVQRLFWGQCV